MSARVANATSSVSVWWRSTHCSCRPYASISRVEHGAALPVEPALFVGVQVPEQPRAHHRRERQRHDQGDEDRDGQGDRELAEQAPDDVRHEEQRDEHRDERDGQGDQREADLLGADQRRLEWRLAFLDVARDVLHHHDRVVHDEAGRDGERHEGEVVDREPGQVHHAEGADQREGHHDARDHRRRDVPEEQERDEHDEPDGEDELVLHVAHRCTDGFRAIADDVHSQGRRQAGRERREQLMYAVHHGDDIGARLPLHVDEHGRQVVRPRRQTAVLRPVHDVSHVRQPERRAVAVGDDQVLVGRRTTGVDRWRRA